MSNQIHPTAVIDPAVLIGQNNYIGPYCHIGPLVTIGNGNRFEAFVSVGSPPEKLEHFDKDGLVIIGDNNVIREYVTVNGGTRRITRMGNRNVMLRHSHLSHDSVLEDDCIISCDVLIGGESYVMKRANLGLGAILHQFSCVGSYAMVGMGSVAIKKTLLEPGGKYVGNPIRRIGDNNIALSRDNISLEVLGIEIERWKRIKEGLLL